MKILSILMIFPAIVLLSFTGSIKKNFMQLSVIDTLRHPAKFGFGRTATAQEIAAWNIAIRPDGKGLPAGKGNAISGKSIYVQKCLACHGTTAQTNTKLLGPILISDTVLKSKPKTIGNYWPYATTLFDYIRRAMPYNQPGSLTNDEVYCLTAYLLTENKIIKPQVIINATSLSKIIMPAKKLFIFDDRKGGREVK